MSSISPNKSSRLLYIDLLIMLQKSNRFSKGNEDIGLDYPRAFFTVVSWWQGQLTFQLLQECLPAMLGCSFSTANYQKSQSEIQKKAFQLWSCKDVILITGTDGTGSNLGHLRDSQLYMSNFPSLHWRREGSIFRSEPEKSSQGHVARRQRLKNSCERMRTPDSRTDVWIIECCVIYSLGLIYTHKT